jgi:methionyl-tRNA formyltransferase
MSSKPLTIVYFGTAEFAVPALRALLTDSSGQFRVAAVVTQPDRPFGRDGVMKRSPVGDVATLADIPLLQMVSLKDPQAVDVLRRLEADFFIVAAYGLIIPQAVLDIPRLGCLNLHGSILPRLRGASPIQEAIRIGDTETGVTLMRMDAQVDHGGTYAVAKVAIAADDTYTTLEKKLGEASVGLLIDSLPKIANGSLQAQEQDHASATFTKLIAKDDGRIAWGEVTAAAIERLRRAYTPWPGIYTVWNKNGMAMRVKLLDVGVVAAGDGVVAGTVFMNGTDVCVKAQEGTVQLISVQPEGKSVMSAKAFVQGNKEFVGAVLGLA